MSRDTGTARAGAPPGIEQLRQQHGCGPVEFSGTSDALYERHLLFDNVVDPTAAGARERYEAFARSARDVLSQRWVRTESTHELANPKRVYYLSMEFLLGRSLANNITNMLLDPVVQHVVAERGADWLGLLEQEPDAGLGNGGLGRLAACFLDSGLLRTGNEPGVFEPLRERLLVSGDYYMHLADLGSYLDADRRLLELHADQDGWTRKVIANIAASGKFSSDHTIAEYAADIWDAKPCPVP